MSKEDRWFFAGLVTFLVLFFGGITIMALASDEEEWIPDGNHYIVFPRLKDE